MRTTLPTPAHSREPQPGHCCRTAAPPRPRQPLGAWIIPGGLLLLLPKCPLCVAGYVAMFTGLSLSFTAASFLRTGLIILCAATLVWLTAKQLLRQKRFHH